MSIAHIKKMLDEERNLKAKQQGNNHACPVIRSMYPSKSRGEMAGEFSQLYSVGYADATSRLLPLLEKAIEMADLITKTRYGAQGYHEEADWEGLSDYYAGLQTEFAAKSREFLSMIEGMK